MIFLPESVAAMVKTGEEALRFTGPNNSYGILLAAPESAKK